MMDNIRDRVFFVKRTLKGETFPPDNLSFATESCYLNLRLICEGLSVALAIPHLEGVDEYNALSRKFFPKDLAATLSTLNGDFFPRRSRLVREVSGLHLIDLTPEISPEYVKSVHGKCGDYLHALTLRKIEQGRKYGQADLRLIAEAIEKIWLHLQCHYITLPDQTIWACSIALPGQGKTGAVRIGAN
ncbi:hypothetical protein K3725_09670 [Leisingera sp. S132]|uniref:hypothetical protein n=1 Tax=Leisingera sp. S132 TaxID=2867016 RepID=UPI0021A53028|nr:hypothetical protein [Leisingera sp. S132]UWQ77591.1 hypothetical protein K3725_09670 [Leisingera sp. S132]